MWNAPKCPSRANDVNEVVRGSTTLYRRPCRASSFPIASVLEPPASVPSQLSANVSDFLRNPYTGFVGNRLCPRTNWVKSRAPSRWKIDTWSSCLPSIFGRCATWEGGNFCPPPKSRARHFRGYSGNEEDARDFFFLPGRLCVRAFFEPVSVAPGRDAIDCLPRTRYLRGSIVHTRGADTALLLRITRLQRDTAL